MDWNSISNWLSQHFPDVASIATFGALLLAFWQVRAATKQTKSLSKIQESLSTRYIGGLKSYYPSVISLIEGAQKSITILCDYPAYGCFTNSKNWLIYHNKLHEKEAEGKVRVTLICPTAAVRKETDEGKYFPDASEANWTNWKKESQHRAQLKMFFLYTPYKNENVDHSNVEKFIDDLSRNRFFELLQQADEGMLQNCFPEADIKQIHSAPPIDFWIIDEMTAIFAFSNYEAGISRYGFWTTDHDLIDAFQQMKGYYLNTK